MRVCLPKGNHQLKMSYCLILARRFQDDGKRERRKFPHPVRPWFGSDKCVSTRQTSGAEDEDNPRAGILRLFPLDQIPSIRPVESPNRSNPCTPIRSSMARYKLVAGLEPSLT